MEGQAPRDPAAKHGGLSRVTARAQSETREARRGKQMQSNLPPVTDMGVVQKQIFLKFWFLERKVSLTYKCDYL